MSRRGFLIFWLRPWFRKFWPKSAKKVIFFSLQKIDFFIGFIIEQLWFCFCNKNANIITPNIFLHTVMGFRFGSHIPNRSRWLSVLYYPAWWRREGSPSCASNRGNTESIFWVGRFSAWMVYICAVLWLWHRQLCCRKRAFL